MRCKHAWVNCMEYRGIHEVYKKANEEEAKEMTRSNCNVRPSMQLASKVENCMQTCCKTTHTTVWELPCKCMCDACMHGVFLSFCCPAHLRGPWRIHLLDFRQFYCNLIGRWDKQYLLTSWRRLLSFPIASSSILPIIILIFIGWKCEIFYFCKIRSFPPETLLNVVRKISRIIFATLHNNPRRNRGNFPE